MQVVLDALDPPGAAERPGRAEHRQFAGALPQRVQPGDQRGFDGERGECADPAMRGELQHDGAAGEHQRELRRVLPREREILHPITMRRRVRNSRAVVVVAGYLRRRGRTRGGSSDDAEGMVAVRGDVRDLGYPVPPDPRRRPRHRAGHVGVPARRDRRDHPAATGIRARRLRAGAAAVASAAALLGHRDGRSRGCSSRTPSGTCPAR